MKSNLLVTMFGRGKSGENKGLGWFDRSRKPFSRRLRLESLEERALLAVTTGTESSFLPAPTGATTWVVNSLSDPTSWSETDNVITLREAISRSTSGDTITFANNLNGKTIILSGSELTIDKMISIDASSLQNGITINGNQKSRIFNIKGDSEDSPVELVNLTIQNGKIIGNGGGIWNSSSLMLINCVLTQNSSISSSSTYGGGIYNSGILMMTQCVVTYNSSTVTSAYGYAYGGGIYNSSNALTIINCSITKNTTTVSDSNDCFLCVLRGGGIYNYSGVLTLTNSSIFGNSAMGSSHSYGGGIYNYTGTLMLTNCSISGNSAMGSSYVYGGGIYDNGSLALTNCTVAGNSTTGSSEAYGGGIYGNSSLTLTNCIVSMNYSVNSENFEGCLINSLNNFIGGAPDFVVVPEFDENGNLTNLDMLDLHLKDTSWGINGGFNEVVAIETDLDGNSRIYDGTVDLGAYEYQDIISNRESISLVVTTLEDTFNPLDGKTSLREAIYHAKTGDTITFDSSLSGGTIILSGSDLSIDKGISIDASSLENEITIDGNQRSQVFYATGGTEDYPIELVNLRIQNGNASHYAGGIYHFGSSSVLTMINCTITENTGEYGGGICNSSGTLKLTNCSVTVNTSKYGGGIYNGSSTLILTNCSIAGNNADYGGGIYNLSTGNLTTYNSIIDYIYNAEEYYYDYEEYQWHYYKGIVMGYNTLSSFEDWTESISTILYDPSKPLFVDAKNGDYSLTEGSQAIDMGKNEYIAGVTTDLVGNRRIVNRIVDLGAYEFQVDGESTPLTTSTIIEIASAGANRHSVTWAMVENTVGYELTYSTDQEVWSRTLSTTDTSLVVTGLTYGDQVYYKVKAVGDGVNWSDSDWSETKSFYVCPMDINGDKIVSSADLTLLSKAWFTRPTSANWDARADIDGSNMVNSSDLTFLSSNWLKRVTSAGLNYPAEKAQIFADEGFDALDVDCDFALDTDVDPVFYEIF